MTSIPSTRLQEHNHAYLGISAHPLRQHVAFYPDHGRYLLHLFVLRSRRYVNLGWLYHGYTQDPIRSVPYQEELEGNL